MREAREEMLQSLNESNLEKMRKASKGAKQTLKMKDGSIGMDSFTASAIMQIYDKVNDKNKKTMENLLKDGKKADIVKLMKFAMSKVNAEYVPEEFEEEVELDEATNYEIKNGKIYISKANFRKVHKDYKNSTKGKERMMALDPKSGATTSFEVVFEEIELDEKKTITLFKNKQPTAYDRMRRRMNPKDRKTVDASDKKQIKDLESRGWYRSPYDEEVDLGEAKYDLYHKDFSTAMQHAYKMAKKMYGITVDPKEIDDKVASGPKKPSEGKTNSYRLKGDKGAIQVQVYNKGGSKPFELNMYKEEAELDEKLDKEDEPTIKKGVKMLKKASGAHAGQAKDLEKAMTEEDKLDEGKMKQLHQLMRDGKSAKEIAKIMKLDVKTIQALMDEKSELEENLDGRTREYRQHRERLELMRSKRQNEKRHIDPADIDTSATDDDIKAADKNIMMQLRKSVSLRGQFPVEFLDKKKVKISQKIALAVIAKYNNLRKPMDKEKFQAKIAKSHRDLLMALKEDIDEAGYVGGKDPMPAGKELAKIMKKKRKGKKESTLELMNKKIQEKKNG